MLTYAEKFEAHARTCSDCGGGIESAPCVDGLILLQLTRLDPAESMDAYDRIASESFLDGGLS